MQNHKKAKFSDRERKKKERNITATPLAGDLGFDSGY
jgi:hypothetical protein